MQILLANAKIMFDQAEQEAYLRATLPISCQCLGRRNGKDECERNWLGNWIAAARLQLKTGNAIIIFMAAEKMPAILAYNGQAYKHVRASSLSEDSLEYAQKHLWITCFLYGLLRPMDGIVPYRMEALRIT